MLATSYKTSPGGGLDASPASSRARRSSLPTPATRHPQGHSTGKLHGPGVRCPIACLLATLLPQRRGGHGNQDPHVRVADVLQTVGRGGIPQDTVTFFQAVGMMLIVGADGALQDPMALLAFMGADG